MKFNRLLTKHIRNRHYSTPIVLAIFAMVANRCLAPRSKLALTEWVEQDMFIPELPRLDVQVVYRAMDFLLSHQQELEQEIYWAVADLLNLEVDLLFFDTTSTYFETETEDDLKNAATQKITGKICHRSSLAWPSLEAVSQLDIGYLKVIPRT